MKDFLLTLAGIGQMIGTWLGIYTLQTEQVTPAPQEQVRFGAINFVGTLPTTLSGSGITSSATSIGVVSMTLQQTGQALSMSDFGTIGYITLEPGVSSRQEFASFTGITQNSNGSAVLTGVTRGLAPVFPYTASSTFRFSHGGGTKLIVSNSPPFYDTFANKQNAASITGQYTFASTAVPQMATNTTDAQIVANGTSSLVTYNLLANTSFAGTVNATEAAKGIIELGTSAETASSTIFGGTGASTVIQTKNATDTPQSKCNSAGSANGAGCVPVAQLDGKISPNFIATSSAYAYNWGASTTFSGGVTMSTTTIFNATTTFNGTVNVVDVKVIVSSSTWTKPSFVSSSSMMMIELWGGGGGGGTGVSNAGSNGSGGGGGGGAYVKYYMLASSATSTVFCNAGLGGASDTVGGNTIFGNYFTAYGGGPGGADSAAAGVNAGGGGGGGSSSGGGTGGPGNSGGGANGGGTHGGAGGASTVAGGSGNSGGGGGASATGGEGYEGGAGGGGGGAGGGASTYGGGGGGGAGGFAGGTSIFAGAGGLSTTGVGGNGSFPSGGGAGGFDVWDGSPATVLGGSGANGQCRITTWK